MWPFKKQKEDLDWTILAKRGLLKAPPQEDDIDFTQQPIPTSSSNESGLGFLGAMSSAAEPSSSSLTRGNNKLDDIEYKIDALSRRLNSMIDRLDLVEKKVDRLERQGAP
jgi:hypothetical protein